MSVKTWKFVLNNWEAKDRVFFESLDCNVIVFGEEVGQSGTPHLQGHITFKRTYRLSALKKLHERTHWEVAKCEDFNYELKGENVFIKDNRQTRGKRTDLESIASMLEEGRSVTEVAKAYPGQYIRYWKGIQELAKVYQTKSESADYDLDSCCLRLNTVPRQFDKTEVIVGDSGIGKTQYALAHFEKPLLVSHIDDLRDFKPEEHDGIVFDDMDFHHCPRTAQIHLVDKDQMRSIHCRYSTASIPKNTKKIFTCNENGFPFIEDEAIQRRINVTYVSGR